MLFSGFVCFSARCQRCLTWRQGKRRAAPVFRDSVLVGIEGHEGDPAAPSFDCRPDLAVAPPTAGLVSPSPANAANSHKLLLYPTNFSAAYSMTMLMWLRKWPRANRRSTSASGCPGRIDHSLFHPSRGKARGTRRPWPCLYRCSPCGPGARVSHDCERVLFKRCRVWP